MGGRQSLAPIRTRRLELSPCSLELARVAARDPAELAQVLQVKVPAAWPSPDLDDALPIYARRLESDPETLGWGLWLILDAAGENLVGDVGFKGKPDAFGSVEIGYGIAPDHQGRGYATEAALAVVEWAFAHDHVGCISAECLDDNVPSVRVLEKLGMRVIAREGRMLKWELKRSS